jgi:lipopolysaccharide/colanic/teichoic acid biosynthesis glycosyltransferase
VSPLRGRTIERALKTVLDRAGAAAGLLLCAPLLGALALLVRLGLGRPVLFRQLRPGRDGVLFEILKLRTMRDGTGPDAERLTPLGRWLRATSLDELPELVNVLRGEMSFVGPRPLLVQYLDRYTPEQRRRHAVTPGITGWAQVNGRNAQSWDDRFAMDLWYVDHWSLLLDLRILARTASIVVRRHGIHAPGSPTMPEFRALGNTVTHGPRETATVSAP